MNKKYIIRKNEEFKKIMLIKKILKNNLFIIYYRHNDLENNRYGISVSKKIGNAVVRNKIKRQIKDILMKNNINYNKDYVIIIRNEILIKNYNQVEESLLKLLNKGEQNEKHI